jgi:hypothetical protein
VSICDGWDPPGAVGPNFCSANRQPVGPNFSSAEPEDRSPENATAARLRLRSASHRGETASAGRVLALLPSPEMANGPRLYTIGVGTACGE